MLAGRDGLQSKGCATGPVRKYACIYIQGDRSERWICIVPASYITTAKRKAGLQERISQNRLERAHWETPGDIFGYIKL